MKYDQDRYSGDNATQWLKKYLHQGLDKWPSDLIIEDLLNHYGNDNPQYVYRGMNFRNENEWNDFMKTFDGHTYKSNGISSWTPDLNTARQFCYVRPTYFPDQETFNQERIAREDNEKLRGYRGLIIKTKIQKHTGIDIRKTDHGYETEILLPAGLYKCEILEIVKPFRQQIENGEVDINQYILSLKNPEQETESMFNHILSHHTSKLSDEAKRHLFKLDSFNLGKVETSIHNIMFSENDLYKSEVNIYYNSRIFTRYEDGVYLDEVFPIIQKAAKRIYTQFHKIALEHSDSKINCFNISHLAELSGQESKHRKLMQKIVGEKYHELNNNSRHSSKEQISALTDHLKDLMNQMHRLI